MKLVDIFKYAFNSLGRHKKRTALTLLGIMVGVTAFTAINSLNVGFQQNIEQELTDAFGANTIIITPKSGPTGYATMFNNSDLEWMREDVKHVESVTGAYGTEGKLTNTNNTNISSTLLLGTDINTLKDTISGIELANGTFPANDTEKNNSLFIGHQIQHYTDNDTFAKIGEKIQLSITIRISQAFKKEVQFNLTLKGSLEETTQSLSTGMGSGMGMGQLNPNKMCFLPLKVLQDKLNTTQLFGLIGKADDPAHVDGVVDEVKNHFGDEDVEVITSKAILATVTDILDRIAIFLIVIASVALLVAGFGIMNTMTMSVSERTKEIGILKSIGATNNTVLGIFLSEALIMGIVGGLLGIGLGYAGGYLLGRLIVVLVGDGAGLFRQMLVPVLTPRTIGISLGISIIISVIFAYWPSKRASNFDPVKALRFG